MYDPINNTYQFSAPIIVTTVIELTWDELLDDAKDYIRFSAASELAESELEDDRKSDKYERFALKAEAELNTTHLKVQNRNLLNTRQIAKARKGFATTQRNPLYPGG